MGGIRAWEESTMEDWRGLNKGVVFSEEVAQVWEESRRGWLPSGAPGREDMKLVWCVSVEHNLLATQ